MKTTFLFALAAVMFAVAPARATVVSYTIQPSLSSLTISGSFSGFNFSQQRTGSMDDTFSGSLTGDLIGSTLNFSGGSVITGDANPTAPFAPAIPNSGPPENYGVAIPALGATGAYRQFVLDLPTGSVTDGAPPAGSILLITQGFLDYNAPPAAPPTGTISFFNTSGPNLAGTNVTITQAGGIETLTLPVSFTFNDSGNTVTQSLDGTLVATRIIPEPAVSSLAALAAAVLGFRRRMAKGRRGALAAFTE